MMKTGLFGRVLLYGGVLGLSAWAGAATYAGKGLFSTNDLLFLGTALIGTASGFLLLRSAFRLGRAMRPGYDPRKPAPSPNVAVEAVKAVGGVAAFAATSFGGFILWSLLFVLFRRI